MPPSADLFGVRPHEVTDRLDTTRVAVRVRRVGLEQDRITGLEPVRVARDVDLDGARRHDEVFGGAGRVRVRVLDGTGRQPELVELDAARLVEREQRARREAAI